MNGRVQPSHDAGPMIRTFSDIVVHPSLEVLRDPGPLFRGGPDWPRFHTRIAERHCWYALPLPVDARPPKAGARETVQDALEEGVWCGPVSFHYGHMIADFGMRLAASARALPEAPLLFSIWPVPGAAPLPFFFEITDHLGIARERLRFVGRPTLVRRLHVLPQAERPYGGGPSRAHLDLMDAITGPAPPGDGATVFVSRAGQPKGKFAGESALEAAFVGAGAVAFRPESAPLKAQIDRYRSAERLIFSEGSAVHTLQLVGRLDAQVIVLGRRRWRRLAAGSLRPRVRSLAYLHALRGLVYGLRASGRPQIPAALTILDEKKLLDRLGRLGVDLAAAWDQAAYLRARDADLAAWTAQRLADAVHPGERATIGKRLKALGLPPVAESQTSTVAASPS